MEMAEDMKMAETVMLVDASFLNFVIKELKGHFELRLGREMNEISLADLFVYLAYDAGMMPGANQIQVLLIYDNDSSRLEYCGSPSDLKNELNNVAFRDSLGEFSFFTFQPDNMVSLEELYLESLKVVADAQEVKKLIVVSSGDLYGEKVGEILERTDGKEIIRFGMNEPEEEISYRWEMLAYPVMQALGIKGEEL